jgi:hypothetical protein
MEDIQHWPEPTLEQARMDTGDILKCLGEPYPYTSENHAPVDVVTEKFEWDLDTKDVDKLVQLRKACSELITVVVSWYTNPRFHGTIENEFIVKMSLRNAYTGINHCRKWAGLGMELAEKLKAFPPVADEKQ